MSEKMRFTVEFEVTWDRHRRKVNKNEIADELSTALSGCKGIENYAWTRVVKVETDMVRPSQPERKETR